MYLQHPAKASSDSHQDHARQASTYCHGARRARLGGPQCHGREGEDRNGDGRPSQLRGGRYLGWKHRQLQMIQVGVPKATVALEAYRKALDTPAGLGGGADKIRK